MEGIGSEPRARTGHSSQAEILGISLIHKSNLVPSGSVGPTLSIVSGLYVAMGISTLFSLEKQWKPTTDNFTSSSLAVVSNKLSLISLLPSHILASNITFRPLCYQGSYQVTSSSLLVGIGTRCTPSNHIPNSSPTRALEVTEQATNQALHRCDKLCLYRTSPIVDEAIQAPWFTIASHEYFLRLWYQV